MSQYLEAYDLNRKRVAVLPDAYDIEEEQVLNGIDTLKFKMPGEDGKREYLGFRRFVRYQDGELYRILDWTATNDGSESVEYICEHVLATLCDTLMFGGVTMDNLSTQTVLQRILAKQSNWVLGACDMSYTYSYNWSGENLLNALWSVPNCFTDYYRWEANTATYPWRVSLRKIDPTAAPQYYVLAGLNFLSSKKTRKSKNIATRIYPQGYGEGASQLDIRSVNGGVPYLQAPQSYIDAYGLVEVPWTDRSIKDAARLKAMAQKLLKEMREPTIEYEIGAADVRDLFRNESFTPRIGDVVLFGPDGYKTYITGIKRRLDMPGDLTLTLATKPSDLAKQIVDIANRQRIESTYAQGSTVLWGGPLNGNADAGTGFVYPLWMPNSMTYANAIRAKIILKRFRTDTKGVKSGGGTTRTSTTNGSSSVTSAHGGDVTLETRALTSELITFPPQSGLQQGSYINYTDYNESDLHTGPSGSLSTGQPSSTNTAPASGMSTHSHVHLHTHTIASHAHNVGKHRHPFIHIHRGLAEVEIPRLTLPSHRHAVDIPGHSHTVTLPDHVHQMEYGIFTAGTSPQSASVKIGGNTAFAMDTTWEGDITQYLVGSDGKIPRGRFVDIEVTPNTTAHVTIVIAAQAFLSGEEGGKY